MRVLLTGAGGQVGRELEELLGTSPHHDVLALGRGDLDVADRERALQVCGQWRPDLVLNAAAFTAVDACESERDRAFAVNAVGPRNLAEGARMVGAHLVHISTDYVFDGESSVPYVEWDQTGPLSVYGLSKLGGEQEVLRCLPAATVVRSSWVCGRYGANMVKTVLRLASGTGPLRFVEDQRGCPTFADELAGMVLRLGVSRLPGIFHVTNAGAVSWFDFAREILEAAGHDPGRVQAVTTSELVPQRPARRPASSVLDNAALRILGIAPLGDHREALERTVKHLLSQT